jgi:hypothetical protein
MDIQVVLVKLAVLDLLVVAEVQEVIQAQEVLVACLATAVLGALAAVVGVVVETVLVAVEEQDYLDKVLMELEQL